MPNLIVPPGGFAGFAQQTAATQAMFQRAGRKGGLKSARKRRAKKKGRTCEAPQARKGKKGAARERQRRR